ncbi:glycosyltransferase family 4 protein [Lutibacter sp.]|uniref:glycosyltransferase family 4 protein n=1 Tax=Lutibacter sp. TaxID=1925666 RepID=UPI001A22A198|nr:glycosyltransferase family 4 protein [Lutibacter sp.]MBI9041549.1 glycosyltransferase family 4 protein [Lutibacter sp.]
MKLLYITNGINGAGGLERVLSIKASYLADEYGYQVTILSLNDAHLNPFYTFSDKIKMKSIRVIGNPLQYAILYIKGIQNVVSEVNPDVIAVCDDGLKAFFTPLILGEKIPIIYERHVSKLIEQHASDGFVKRISTKIKWFLMNTLGNKFQKFVVLTKGNLLEWKKLSNLQVISNPLSFFPTRSSSLENKKVIAVGKQGYQKGYDLLLPAWKIVAQKHPDWKLEVYGTFNPKENLEPLAIELEIEKSVSFKLPVKEIEQKYLEAAIYVMSSRYEGFGMVLIEAMACGVPCVSFNCNYGPSDIIKNGVDGYLAAQQNSEALASKLLLLIENEALRKELGQKAKQNVQRYLPEKILKQWDELFKSVVQ